MRANTICSVYSLFSALIMHVYQMRSSNQSIVSATQQRLTTCMNALRDVSKVWLVAKMVHTLFESILGNKVLEERLQKAAGRRHAKSKQNGISAGSRTMKNMSPHDVQQQQKRKYDDMELGYANGPPAPQVSYERSRPQSPAVTPSRELPQQQNQNAHHQQLPQQQIPHISATSPHIHQSTDAFMGTSRANTRPTTPFNTYSYPGTPPDLFLHTRGSPKISEDLWQNYDPGQLFPPEANGMLGGVPLFGPGVGAEGMVDPALRAPPPQQQQQAAQQAQMSQQQLPMHDGQQMPQQMSQHGHPQQQHAHPNAHMHSYNQQGDPQGWADLQPGLGGGGGQQHQQRVPDDQWSNSSGTGPIVPTTLNVGDWFEFFGIPNGDLGALGGGQHGGGGGGGRGYG